MAWKPDTGQKIERLYAWISVEPDGGEGLCAMMLGDVMWPMVGADQERIESLRPQAVMISRLMRRPVVLKVFDSGTVIDELQPEEPAS